MRSLPYCYPACGLTLSSHALVDMPNTRLIDTRKNKHNGRKVHHFMGPYIWILQHRALSLSPCIILMLPASQMYELSPWVVQQPRS